VLESETLVCSVAVSAIAENESGHIARLSLLATVDGTPRLTGEALVVVELGILVDECLRRSGEVNREPHVLARTALPYSRKYNAKHFTLLLTL
jgi:hypothetical protein